jgi:hypothetical protein
MPRFLVLLLALLIAGPVLGQTVGGQTVVQTDNVRAELVADVSAVKGDVLVGLRQTIRPKWHLPKNPGDLAR